MADIDLQAERDKIQREIEALEKSLGSSVAAALDASDSSDDSDDDLEDRLEGGYPADDVIWEDGGSSAEMCLQMNLVYQAVIEEKLQELEVLIAQNKEQQEELMWELAGRKTQRAGATKVYPLNLALGHFMKPYFKDKVTGVGPPGNPEMRERGLHIVKAFPDHSGKKWRSLDSEELRKAVFSDTLQRMLQPKLLKVEYLQQKHDGSKCDIEKKILKKQIHEAEREIDDINQLKENELLGQITDAHDWDKIANINFEGIHTAERLSRIWQTQEHPHINKTDWPEEEIEKLKEIAEDHNYVDWQTIAQELGTNRTAFQCLQTFQWNNKDFKRSEFTKEEDEMLTHFVHRMRVGEHIPYRKISYFMEGRDGLQLLYRWTKCLLPDKRKGPWSKEEDEILLKAVAKYGEKSWYKIRDEVPGRNDVQCRERYLQALHKGVKKGKWSEEEEEKLLELTNKYGVGHWAKMSRELCNRTASQCLSKWKHVSGFFKRRRQSLKQLGLAQRGPQAQRKRSRSRKPPEPPKAVTAVKKIKKEMVSDEELSSGSCSSSSESSFSSSSESEDEAMELMDPYGEKEISNLLQSLPDLDLWVPKKRTSGLQEKGLLVYHDSPNKLPRNTGKSRRKSFQFNTILKGISYPPSTDKVTETVEDYLKEAEKKGNEVLQIREEDIVRILSRNTKETERKQMQRLSQRQNKSLSDSDADLLKVARSSLSQFAMTRLYKASVDRKLLSAVTKWVGNVLLPLSTSRASRSRRKTQADALNKKLMSCVTITSTPIFTLLIQFFQIDAEGCLQMIRMRRIETSEFLKRVKSSSRKITRRLVDSDFMSPKSILVQSLSDQDPNPVNPQATQEEITAARRRKRQQSIPKIPKVRPVVPLAPKLKTVSELLREKRMQKSNATKAIQRNAVISRNILLPTQIFIQQPANAANPPVRPQTVVLPVAPTTSETGSQPVRLISPMPVCQVLTKNNVSGNQNSLVSGEPISRPEADPTGRVPASHVADVQRTGQSTSSGGPPATQQLPYQVKLLSGTVLPASNSPIPVTFLITSRGLISIPTQALQGLKLIQQSGNQSPRIVSTPLNTAANNPCVTESNRSISNAPSDTLRVPAQLLPDTSSSKTQERNATPSPVNCPQTTGPELSRLPSSEASGDPSKIFTSVNSYLNQVGPAVTSLVGSLPQVVVSLLPTIAPTKVSKIPSPALPTITSSIRHDDMTTTSSAVCSPLVAAPSDALKMPSPTLPGTGSSVTQDSTGGITLVDSQPQLTGSRLPALTPSSTSNFSANLPAVTSSLTKVGTAAFSPVVSLQKLSSHQLPILAPSKSSMMPSQVLPAVTSSMAQVDMAVFSPVVSLQRETSPHLPILAPSTSSMMPPQIPPAVTSSMAQVDTAEFSPVVSLQKETSPHLPILAPSTSSMMPPQVLPAVSSSLTQVDTAEFSPVVSLQKETSPHLPILAPSTSSMMPPQIPPAVTSSLTQQHKAAFSPVVNLPKVTSPHLPIFAPSKSSMMPPQIPPAVSSSLTKVDTAVFSPVVSLQKETSPHLPILAPSTSSMMPPQIPPAVSSSSAQVDTAAFSPVVNLQKETSPHLPILAPSKSSMMPSQIPLVVASSREQKQEGTLVASSFTSPEKLENLSSLAPGLPDKATQLKLTPQKYPIVKIAKLLKTDLPKEDAAHVTSDPPRNPVPNETNPTTNSERNLLEVKLISLEEEATVKEWLQGNQGMEESKQTDIPYLPPSICTLKTFSRLLQEKKKLEENAFKLLPFLKGTEVSPQQRQATLSAVVEQRLKDNLAYQLLKQRFLSAFTIPGFLAVLPPTPSSKEEDSDEDSDEDIEDLMDIDTDMVEVAHNGNNTTAEGDSVDNLSGEATPMLVEQETMLHSSAEDDEVIITRRSVYCRPVT